jgi:hypothetical protein
LDRLGFDLDRISAGTAQLGNAKAWMMARPSGMA